MAKVHEKDLHPDNHYLFLCLLLSEGDSLLGRKTREWRRKVDVLMVGDWDNVVWRVVGNHILVLPHVVDNSQGRRRREQWGRLLLYVANSRYHLLVGSRTQRKFLSKIARELQE